MRDAELLFLTGLLQLGLFSGASEQSGTDMPLPVATSFFALSVGAFVASALLAVTRFGVVRSELMLLCALVPTLAVVFNFVGGAIAASVGLSLPAVAVALAVLASLLALAPVVEARVTGLVVRSHQHVVLFGGGTAIAAILSVARPANGDPLSTGFTLMLAAAVGLTFAPLISVVAMRRRGAR
ncbi:MAG: hypothetical protein DI556_13380 [Rhodovulum sulfidophilum]|uniref:Uncharacterized protein n=1 Tax=Rhodovulum sulfidophilum TaxID=35806 RepID=A0A2W5N5N5_RHOSU|nr:MAG: hypothetical protein DI556_13380 [Rhodovulum sulfidophilum]